METNNIKYNWAKDWIFIKELAGKEYDNVLLKVASLERRDNSYIQLSQNWDKMDYYACTIYANVLAVASQNNYSEDDAKRLLREVYNEAIRKNQFDVDGWAYTYNSWITTQEVNNKMFPNSKVEFRKTTWWTSLFNTLLNRNFNLVVTYITSKAYSQDKADWELDWTSFTWSTWGHCLRIANVEEMKSKSSLPEYIWFLDNYFRNWKYERYKTKRTNSLKLSQKNWGIFYENVYFFLPI